MLESSMDSKNSEVNDRTLSRIDRKGRNADRRFLGHKTWSTKIASQGEPFQNRVLAGVSRSSNILKGPATSRDFGHASG